MNKLSLGFVAVLGVFLLLAIGASSQTAGQDAAPSGSSWVLDGSCVYWDSSKGTIRVCPHTLTGSGWVNVEFTNKAFGNNTPLSFAFGTAGDSVSFSEPQIRMNANHPYKVANCSIRSVEVLNNGTPEVVNERVCNPYLVDDYYVDLVGIGSFSGDTYGGKSWSYRDALWEQGTVMNARVWVDVKPRSGLSKYEVLMKPAGDSFATSASSGNSVLLDPWVNSPSGVFNETFDDGAFVNQSSSLNVSRGFLILNLSGYNETNFFVNASDDGVAGQCRNSSQDASQIGSTTAYVCSNLYDGVTSTFDSNAVWSGNGFTEPEWIVRNFPEAVWLYNISEYTNYAVAEWQPANYSWQCSDTALDFSGITPTPGGSDAAGNWNYATFNISHSTTDAPGDPQTYTMGQIYCRSLRMHLHNWQVPNHAIWLAEIQASRTLFQQSGSMNSTVLNSTIQVRKINATCVNVTGNEPGVKMNITVWDANHANEQTITCDGSSNGFVNNVNDFTGLGYSINFSAAHSGLTPTLDYLTLRVDDEGSSGPNATEAEGDTAILAAITNYVPSATRYANQKIYVVNSSNAQFQGTVDWLVVQDNPPKRWLLNYITAGESYLNAPNLSTVVYVRELTNKTIAQITSEMSVLLDATK